MAYTAKREGNKLILTIDLADKPVQAKSAVAKAIEKGQKAETVPATVLASSGGFIRHDGFKVSFNIGVA